MSSNTAKVNVAATQALQAGASPRDLEIARKYLGTKNFIGYCQSFVRQITGGKTQGASAIQAWNNAPQKIQGVQGIQPGDLIYFAPDKSNENYGHTGIYNGQGQMISATYNGVKQNSLFDWIKQTGQKILGYVPGNNRQPEQQSQQFTPQTAINHNVQMRQSGIQSNIPIPIPPVPDQMDRVTKKPMINLNTQMPT